MTRGALVFALGLWAAACRSPPLALPPRPPSVQRIDLEDRFPVAPRPACSAEANTAFSATDPAAITTAAAGGVTFACGDLDAPTFTSRAVFANDTDRLERLLATGTDPNARWGGRGDRLPLQDAIECRQFGFSCDRLPIVRMLLAHGADPNARWCEFESRLGVAEVPGCTSEGGWTPLVAAAATDAADVVYLLLDAGADPWVTTGEGFVALDFATSVPVYQLIAATMFGDPVTRGADARRYWEERPWPNWHSDPRLQTRLTAVVSGGVSAPPPSPPPPPPPDETNRPAPEVKALRDSLPGVHYIRPRLGQRAALVAMLLDQGEDANRRLTGRSDWTPLMLAVARNDHYSAVVLLEAGADPNARVCGAHPTGWMSERPPFEVGCDIGRGTSPLMLAAATAAVDTMQRLVARGGDLGARDWRGRSVADYAPAEARAAIMAAVHPPTRHLAK